MAETAYVVGGLYGNHAALRAILDLQQQEAASGLPLPRLIFNGDFHWFDAAADRFAAIDRAVLTRSALAGNVETGLADPQPGAGCGCAYPDSVDDATVDRSNQIMARLHRVAAEVARTDPGLRKRLAALPRQLRLRVGAVDVGVVHGDPENLAGWGLAVEAMPPPGATDERIRAWFRAGDVRVLACTHTCLPFAQDFHVDGRTCLVANNGSAGMPNFRGDPRIVITRISRHPPPLAPLYGMPLRGVRCDALALHWNRAEWLSVFRRLWPPGSPARSSYAGRLRRGPNHSLAKAARIDARA